ncbi:flagellin [Gemmobacter sp. 24YEA27]|uniref:flagellin n=1 Tax=Gemmobacter sp. 24YEA27 TaxID=3040672 RepID=UPI0024B3B54E|nr:flagellin [Gemmobacter sp. 24YEA27]
MSSILTNSSAMVALQTLKTINSNMNKVQSEISTGKTVATARDNAAVWSISKVMESDVKGFKGISDSLALGSSSLSVAREASEKIQGLLNSMKEKIVSAQSENVPREKLQTDIDALRNQIAGIVSGAQFSGLNLVSGTDDVKFLASLDRSDSGVTTSDITVARQDLSAGNGTLGVATGSPQILAGVAVITGNITAPVDLAGAAVTSITNGANSARLAGAGLAIGASATLKINGQTVSFTNDSGVAMTAAESATRMISEVNKLGLEGVTAVLNGTSNVDIQSSRAFEQVTVEHVAGFAAPTIPTAGQGTVAGSVATIAQRAETYVFGGNAVKDGDGYTLSVGGVAYSYVAGKGETTEDVVRGLKIAIDAGKVPGLSTRVTQSSTGAWQLNIDNSSDTARAIAASSGTVNGKASGGLFGLGAIDVTTIAGARSALSNIETMINKAIDAAAEFGSAQGRIDTQTSFVSSLTDAMTAGIGTLVDADMEEASARLQALQVQQQLGIQALSIANQQPQNLLSLFR